MFFSRRGSQRAFRERKERHVRELEEKVNNLEQASSNLVADNERLKRELARFTTENEILRARLPKKITTTPEERRKLVKVGSSLSV